MANRTVKDAQAVRGTNPQYLIEKIIRSRIYDSRYWKEECFALSAELLVDKAMELKFVGGVHGGNIKPTPFLCLILKMLQIQPEKDIIIEFIRQEDFKYVRALGAMYMRLVGTSLDCFKYLEPLYNDYRKIRKQNRQAAFEVVHMDEFIDELLQDERVCDVILPRIQKRQVLEANNEIDPRISALEDDLEEPESEDERKDAMDAMDKVNNNHSHKEEKSKDVSPMRRRRSPRKKSHSPRRHSRDRDRDRHRRRSRSRGRERKKDHHRSHDKNRKHRSRSRSIEKHRERKSRHHSRYCHKSRERKDRSRHISQEDPEIAEANAMRSRLGLPILRR